MNSEYFSKRFEAVFLHLHHRGPKLSIQQTANQIKKSRHFVQYWVEQWEREKNVDDKPNVQPERSTTPKENERIVDVFEQNPGITLDQGVERLSQANIRVSRSTVRRRLQAKNVQYRPTIKKPLLTKIHVEKRLRWATENLDTDWSKVIYTDESSFWLSNHLSHTWCSASNRTVVRTIKHPQKVHVYGAFCEQGFGNLTIFTGNLDAARMVKLYRSTLLPTARKYYGGDKSKWILLEDNDPKHKSHLCSDWKDEHDIEQMVWPPQSPDCNPIENVWSVIKSRLRGKIFSNIHQLSLYIRRQWLTFPREYAENLSKSMPSRCARVVEQQGEWIKY